MSDLVPLGGPCGMERDGKDGTCNYGFPRGSRVFGEKMLGVRRMLARGLEVAGRSAPALPEARVRV